MEAVSTISIALAKPERRLSLQLGYLIFPCALMILILFMGYGKFVELGSERRWLITLAVIAPIIIMALRDPAQGLCIFAAAIIPIDILMDNGYVSYATIHLIIVPVTLLFFRKTKKNKTFQGGKIFAFLFMGLIIIQLGRAQDFIVGVQKALACLDTLLVLYFCITYMSNIQLKKVLNSYFAGLVLSILFVLVTHDWSLNVRLGDDLLLNPNNIALPCALGLIYLRYIQTTMRVGQWTWIAAAILMIALMLTSSRAAIMALLLGILVLTNAQRRFSKLIGISLLMTLIIFILFKAFFFETATGVHMLQGLDVSSTSVDVDSTMGIRAKLFNEGIFLFLTNPIVGIGWTNFAPTANIQVGKRVLPAHNMFLEIAAEMGLIGLSITVIWLFLIYRYALRQNRDLGLAATAALLVWAFTHGNFLSGEIAIFWPIALGIIERKQSPRLSFHHPLNAVVGPRMGHVNSHVGHNNSRKASF